MEITVGEEKEFFPGESIEVLPEPERAVKEFDISPIEKALQKVGVETKTWGLFIFPSKPLETLRQDQIEERFEELERKGFSLSFSHSFDRILTRRQEDPDWFFVWQEYRRLNKEIFKYFYYKINPPYELFEKFWRVFKMSLVPWSFSIRHFDIPCVKFSGKFSFAVLRFWTFSVWVNPRASYTFKYIENIMPSFFSGPSEIKFEGEELFP